MRTTGVIASKIYEQRLAIVNLATRETARYFAGRHVCVRVRLVAGRKELGLSGRARFDGDDNWFIAELYAIDVGTGAVRARF